MKQYHSFPVHRYCKHGCPPFSLERLVVTSATKANGPVIFRYSGKKKKGKKRGKCNTSGVSCFLFKTTPLKITVPFLTNGKRSL